MSLEAAIAELTTAIKELIGETKELRNMRSEAIDKVGSALQNVAGAKAKDTKAKDESKPKEDAKPATSADPYDGVKDLIAKYVTGTDREEERTARKAKVKALLSHEKIKKPEVSENDPPSVEHIMESAVSLFKDQINKLIEKGDLTSPKSDDLDL